MQSFIGKCASSVLIRLSSKWSNRICAATEDLDDKNWGHTDHGN